MILTSAGRRLIKKYHQRCTLYLYTFMSIFGLWAYRNLFSTAYRAAALGLLFPRAGFLGVGTLPSFGAFLLTLVLFPVTIFIWFAMGGIFFPIALWLGSPGAS